jgi:hypothetical protein
MVVYKEYASQLAEIKVKRDELANIITTMPESTAKKAFEYVIMNIDKKLVRFQKIEINPDNIAKSEEEKELLRKFRAGEGIKVPKRDA